MTKAAKKQEKQIWAMEKPKHDNAPKLRGINIIDLEDEEFEETLKTHEIYWKLIWKRQLPARWRQESV